LFARVEPEVTGDETRTPSVFNNFAYGKEVCQGEGEAGNRSVQRHARKENLDEMFANTQNPSAKRDIKTRQHLMVRSFARSVRYSSRNAIDKYEEKS